jgi:localization factor PodJL
VFKRGSILTESEVDLKTKLQEHRSSSMNPKILIIGIVLAVAGLGAAFFLLQKNPQGDISFQAVQPPNVSAVDLAALKTKAESGDPAAQTSLGKIFLEGAVVKADVKEAVKWFQLAADKNYPDALAALGELTQAGQGVPLNLEAAAQLYRRAAQSGSVAGQYNLAYLYEQGTGVKQDESEAAKWYQLAAEGGDPVAQYDIGQRYELGVGVATNRVQAFKWLSLAAAQGQPDSAKRLPGLKREMSGPELSEAGQLVKEFTPRSPKPFMQATN